MSFLLSLPSLVVAAGMILATFFYDFVVIILPVFVMVIVVVIAVVTCLLICVFDVHSSS